RNRAISRRTAERFSDGARPRGGLGRANQRILRQQPFHHHHPRAARPGRTAGRGLARPAQHVGTRADRAGQRAIVDDRQHPKLLREQGGRPRARRRREDARAPQLCGGPRRHSDPGDALARAWRLDQPKQRQHAIPLFLGLSFQESSAPCLRRLRAAGDREPAAKSAFARVRGFGLDFRPPRPAGHPDHHGSNEVLSSLARKIAKYIPPQLYRGIFAGKDVEIATERKKLTIFFSDVVDFTATAERMQPEELTALLNEYLTEMSSIAAAHGGTVNKFIGDAI